MALNIKGKWRPVAIDCEDGLDLEQLEGLISFEELTDYTITDDKGKISKVTNRPLKKSTKKLRNDENQPAIVEEDSIENLHDSVKAKTDTTAWDSLYVSEPIKKALSEMQFIKPTPIQSLSLVAAIRDRKDIIGAAETGSGKTLAYGIPIIERILQLKETKSRKAETPLEKKKSSKRKRDKVSSNEEAIKAKKKKIEKSVTTVDASAISISDSTLSDETTIVAESSDSFKPCVYALILTPTRELALQVRNHLRNAAKYTKLRIEAIVGGMSQHKQQRLLNYQPEIIIATPGRMWQLLSEGESHLETVNKLPLLVLDEVDRMIEYGHFTELSNILERLPERPIRQTLVYSATVTINKNKKAEIKKNVKNKSSNEKIFDTLIQMLKLDKKIMVIDLIQKDITVETLVETRINCLAEEKLSSLYLFRLLFPGKTLVFANSISCVKKVAHTFRLLEQPAFTLHAKMQQRQRLKSLDGFKSSPNGLIFCTDVAARGIDVKDIKYVIHYELPKTFELYIHRCGRTARAASEGMSVMLLSPKDMLSYRTITKMLSRDIPEFPLDRSFEGDVKKRIGLAERIVKLEKASSRVKSHEAWLKTAADTLDVALDDEIDSSVNSNSKAEAASRFARKKLAMQLKIPLTNRNFSGKFPAMNEILAIPSIENHAIPDNDDTIAAVKVLKRKNKRKGVPKMK